MTDEEKIKEIEAIKDRLRNHLAELSELRKQVLCSPDLNEPQRIEKVFTFADQLSDLCLAGFDIDHLMMSDIITALVALIAGISRGIGADELRRFLAFQERMGGTKATSMH